MSLAFICQSVNGVKTKLHKVKLKIETSDYDAIVVRNFELDGGGCIIAIKKKYHFNRMTEWELDSDDLKWS